MRPWAYFLNQVELLALVSERADGLDDLLRAGMQIGRTRLGLRDDGGPETDEREQDRNRFLVAQAEVLLHHAAETLLRLYLAHEAKAPCPWLEIAETRSFREFKKAVRGLASDLDGGRERSGLMRTFFIHDDPDAFQTEPRLTQEQWDERQRNISSWLAWFASYFLDANVYNAAKHGLAVIAGDSGIQLGWLSDPSAILGRRGPSLIYVEEVRGRDGPEWRRTMKWINLETHLLAIFVACNFMRAIMAAGAAVRGGSPPRRLMSLSRPTLGEVLDRDVPASGVAIASAHIGMAYLLDRRPAGKRQR